MKTLQPRRTFAAQCGNDNDTRHHVSHCGHRVPRGYQFAARKSDQRPDLSCHNPKADGRRNRSTHRSGSRHRRANRSVDSTREDEVGRQRKTMTEHVHQSPASRSRTISINVDNCSPLSRTGSLATIAWTPCRCLLALASALTKS